VRGGKKSYGRKNLWKSERVMEDENGGSNLINWRAWKGEGGAKQREVEPRCPNRHHSPQPALLVPSASRGAYRCVAKCMDSRWHWAASCAVAVLIDRPVGANGRCWRRAGAWQPASVDRASRQCYSVRRWLRLPLPTSPLSWRRSPPSI